MSAETSFDSQFLKYINALNYQAMATGGSGIDRTHDEITVEVIFSDLVLRMI